MFVLLSVLFCRINEVVTLILSKCCWCQEQWKKRAACALYQGVLLHRHTKNALASITNSTKHILCAHNHYGIMKHWPVFPMVCLPGLKNPPVSTSDGKYSVASESHNGKSTISPLPGLSANFLQLLIYFKHLAPDQFHSSPSNFHNISSFPKMSSYNLTNICFLCWNLTPHNCSGG